MISPVCAITTYTNTFLPSNFCKYANSSSLHFRSRGIIPQSRRKSARRSSIVSHKSCFIARSNSIHSDGNSICSDCVNICTKDYVTIIPIIEKIHTIDTGYTVQRSFTIRRVFCHVEARSVRISFQTFCPHAAKIKSITAEFDTFDVSHVRTYVSTGTCTLDAANIGSQFRYVNAAHKHIIFIISSTAFNS